MKTPYLYFAITKNCLYQCKHCYIEAGPGKKNTTINEKDFRQIVHHLPKISLDLDLSGGEIFTIKNELYGFLDYLSYENKRRRRKRQGKIRIGLQTTGFWAVNDEKIKSVLFDLASFGVADLDIPSDDVYHRKQGVKPERPKRLAEIAKESGLFNYVKVRGNFREWIAPVGRAKNMGLRLSKEIFTNDNLCNQTLDDYRLQLFPDGSVYNCFALRSKLPGNVIERDLVTIVQEAKQVSRLKTINDRGIRGLAKQDGWKCKDIDPLIKKYGPCGFCFKAYKDSAQILKTS